MAAHKADDDSHSNLNSKGAAVWPRFSDLSTVTGQEIVMPAKSIIEQAAALAAKTHKVKAPLIVDSAEARDPKTGKPVHRITVVSAANANGPAYAVTVDESGAPLAVTPTLDQLFDRAS